MPNLPLAAFKATQTYFTSGGGVEVSLMESQTSPKDMHWVLMCAGGVRGGVYVPEMKRANGEGAAVPGEQLLCGRTKRQFLFLPPSTSPPPPFLLTAACTQPAEMRQTPFGMSDKHTFEMTCSFHACHKVRGVSAASGESERFTVA